MHLFCPPQRICYLDIEKYQQEAMNMQKITKLIILIEMVDELIQNRVNHEEEMFSKTLEKNMTDVANRLELIEQQKEYLFALK